MRIDRDEWAMQLAHITSQRATCRRRKVGAVFLNERGHVIATGYNGNAAGLPHCLDHPCKAADALSGTNLDGCMALHAEANALLQCKDVYCIDTAYVTTSPCVHCVKLLLNTSCKRIVFSEDYPHSESEAIWKSANRIWRKL